MAKTRSPNYPSIGLGNAIEGLRAIWTKEQRTPVTAEVAAKHLGYSGLNGVARMKLSALKKYGLLEESALGWKVSPLGLRILHHQVDSDEYLKAVREAAFQVELFRKIAATHAQASTEALRSYLLLNESFSEAGAKQFIGAFKDTLAVAKWGVGADIGLEDGKRGGGDEVPEGQEERDLRQNQQFMGMMIGKDPATGAKAKNAGGNLWFKVPFGSTDLSVRIEVSGDSLKREHVAKIRKYLELAEDDMSQSSDSAQAPAADKD